MFKSSISLMLFCLLILLIFSNAVLLRRDKSTLYNRITLTMLVVTCYIIYDSTYISFIDKGIALFGGSFHLSSLTEVFHLLVLFLTLFIFKFFIKDKVQVRFLGNFFSNIISPVNGFVVKKNQKPKNRKNTNHKHVNKMIDLLYEKPIYKLLLSYLTCFLLKKNIYKYNKNDYNKVIKNSYNQSYPNSLTCNINNKLNKVIFNNKLNNNSYGLRPLNYNEIQYILYVNMNSILVHIYNKKKEHFVLSKVFIYIINFTLLFVIFNLICFNYVNLFYLVNINLFIINYFYRFMKKYINNELILREFLFAFLLMFSKLTNFSSLFFFFKDLIYIICPKLWYYIKSNNKKIISFFILFIIFKALLIYYFDFKNTTFIETINYALSTYFLIYTFIYFISIYIVGFKREPFTIYNFFINFKVEGFLIYLFFLYLTPYFFLLNLFNKYILPMFLYTKLDFLTVFLENLNRFLDLPIRKDKVINTEDISNYVKGKYSNSMQEFLNNFKKDKKSFSLKSNFIYNPNLFKKDSIHFFTHFMDTNNFMDTNKIKGIGSKDFQKWVFKRSYYYYIYNKSFYMLNIANPWEWLHCIAHNRNISKESFTGWATNKNYSEKLYTVWKKNPFFFHDHKKCDHLLNSVDLNNLKLKIDRTSPWQKFFDNINSKQSFKFNGINYHKGTTLYDTQGYPEPPRYNLVEKLSPSPYRRVFKDKIYHTVGTLYDRKWLFYSDHDKKCRLNKSFINYFYISEPNFPIHIPTESPKVDLVFSKSGIIYPRFAWEINEVTGRLRKIPNYGVNQSPAQSNIDPSRNQLSDKCFRSKLYYEREKWKKVINDSSISQNEKNKRFLERIEELQQELYTYKIFEYRNIEENKKKVKFIMPDLGGNPIMVINPEGIDDIENIIYMNNVYNTGNIFIGSYSHATPIVLSSIYNKGFIDVNTTT